MAEQRERAIFWHLIWKQCGSPINGVVAGVRRYCRAKYHYAVRQTKIQADTNYANKLATALANKRASGFWSELRHIKGSSKPKTGMVDGVVSGADISEHLATKYNALYNSVSYSHNEMSEVVDDIDKRCHEHRHETVEDDEMCICTTQISVNNVNNAITKLKLGKSDGNNGLTTDHLKQGSLNLYVAISVLFSMMLSHGYIPISMHHSIIIPIAKNKRKYLNDGNN